MKQPRLLHLLRHSGRYFFCASLLALPLIEIGCSRSPQQQDQTGEKNPQAKAIWTCSMHPQVQEDHPGTCPICGMALVPIHSHAEMQASTPALTSPPVTTMSVAANPLPPPEMSASAEAVIHLDEARSSVASIQTTAVENRMVQRKIDLFGEIAYISASHLAFTWYFGGRIQTVLIDYNTTEVSAGLPIMIVYSEDAIADQRAY